LHRLTCHPELVGLVRYGCSCLVVCTRWTVDSWTIGRVRKITKLHDTDDTPYLPLSCLLHPVLFTNCTLLNTYSSSLFGCINGHIFKRPLHRVKLSNFSRVVVYLAGVDSWMTVRGRLMWQRVDTRPLLVTCRRVRPQSHRNSSTCLALHSHSFPARATSSGCACPPSRVETIAKLYHT
jgi:hypothetical protein